MFFNHLDLQWAWYTRTKSLFIIGMLFLGIFQIGMAQDGTGPPPPPFDVELAISTPNVEIGQWKRLPVTVTISNSGFDVAARNIVVRIGACTGNPERLTFEIRRAGIVYANSTTTSTTGDFNLLRGMWSIPLLPGESSATLTIDYFTLTDEPIKLFAFVEEMEGERGQLDIDSSPRLYASDLSCEVTEDDEALLILNPEDQLMACEGDITLTTQREVDEFFTNCFAQTGQIHGSPWTYNGSITLEGSDINNLDALVDLRSIRGDFSIINTSIESLGRVLLTGAALSGDFIARDNNNLKNVNLGSIIALDDKSSITIRNNANLETIYIPYDGNRMHSVAIHENPNLKEIEGGNRLRFIESLTIGNNEQLTSFSTPILKEVTGNLAINFTALSEIDFSRLSTLKGQLTIGGNSELTTIKGFDNLKELGGSVTIADNDKLSTLGDLEKIEFINGGLTIVQSDALVRINLPNLRFIGGDVFINQLSAIRDLRQLSSLDVIHGQLTITENAELLSISGLQNLTALNQNSNPGGLVILDNPKLSDCCVVRDLLEIATVAGNTDIRNNAGGCTSIPQIENSCIDPPTGKIDLEIDITSLNRNPKLYTKFPVKLRVKNNSSVKARDVRINAFNFCDNGTRINRPAVFVGGSAKASKGTYSLKWIIPELAAGEEAFLEVEYFVLEERSFAMKAEVESAIPKEDIDSTPRLFEANTFFDCVITEDDEDILAFNIPELTTCDLLNTIDIDPCNPAVNQLATYRFRGRVYLVTTPSNSNIGPTVRDCETGEIFCFIDDRIADAPVCLDFITNDATFLEVISSKEECQDCGCETPIDGIPFVCGSDGKTYDTSCHAECAGVTWTEGLCVEERGITCGEITVIPGIDQLTIKGTPGEKYFFKVYRTSPRWEYVFECNANCGSEVTINNLPTATYFVDVYNKSWKLICDDIEVSLIAIDGGLQEVNPTTKNRNSVLNTTNSTISKPFSIYPNPAQHQATLNLNTTVYPNAQLYISNHLGQLVKTIPFGTQDQMTLSLDHFENGLYQVNVVADGQIVAAEKLVIMK